MAEPINLAPVRVHAISVPMRPDPTQLHKFDEMMLQANGDDTVQADLFGTDPQGKPYHESRTFNEQEYEQLRKHFMTRELATLPPFSSFKSGNTIGRVVGETVPAQVSASEANPPIEAETEEEGITGEQILDGIQLGLDVFGLIPVVGEVADIASGIISLARGDYVGAGLSLLSAIPFVGYAGTAGKATRYGAKMAEASGKAGKEVVDKATKAAAEKKARDAAARKQEQGARITPKKLRRVEPKCFDPRNSKRYKKMSETEQKEYLREYARQLKRQQDSINSMSAKDFASARAMFNDAKKVSRNGGRNPKAAAAQDAYRSKRAGEIKDSIYESIRRKNPQGDPKAARAEAADRTNEIMDSLAALHEPDMVAGGWHEPTPSSLGNKGVNSAIGGSWNQKGRVKLLQDAAEKAVARGDGSDIMNVELKICPPGRKGK
ncbi:polymorphic toxin type 15 domain-containing protein [Pseudomonas sp. EA_15y_Pfl1_P104]|uniref:polymorphic toxin type 15 domain-containing protein n=1 Tax=Pseudomonas sp. EA_15y_Pfl1_P104 TaxID=3088686 RepID=UPI0030DDBF4F